MHHAFRLTPALLAILALTVIAACGAKTDNNAQKTSQTNAQDVIKLETPPAGQLPEGVTPTAYRLNLVTDPSEDGFSGHVDIDVSLAAPHSRIWLHSVEQTVTQVSASYQAFGETHRVDGQFTGNQAEGGVSRLDFDEALPFGPVTLHIDYTAPYNHGLTGLYQTEFAGKPYLASQMEATDARRMVPSFDEPRFKTPWTLSVTAPAGLAVISNGAEESAQDTENGMVRHQFATTRPIQSYLLALAVGPYDSRSAADIPANTLRDTPIALRGFAPEGKGDKLATALDATGPFVLWQEAYFDYPYPYGKLDLIAVPDFAYGAMENAGAIIYRESALLIDERTSLARKRGILTTVAHELGHQWFGNLVTPKWWDDIWLNEAFATWISFKIMDDYDPEGGWERAATRAGLGAMGTDSLANARQIRNPIERNADIDDAFDAITYRKGAHVLSMFETYLGEEKFRSGIRLHMKRHADGVADVDDFMKSVADGSGDEDVVDSFKTFILQPGIPLLDVQSTCPAIDAGLITITQTRYAPLGSGIDAGASKWIIPFAAHMSGPNGDAVHRVMLREDTSTIALDGGCPDWVMPNAGGAGYWRFTTNPENWQALATHYSELNAGEQLVYADSLTAGFANGAVSSEDLLKGLEASAAGEWDAASQPFGMIATLDEMLSDADRTYLHKWVQETYGPRYQALAERADASLSQGESLLRADLFELLIEHGDMQSARQDLARRASLYIGLSADPQPDAISPSELGLAIATGTKSGGRPFYDAALAYAMASDNQREKRTIYGALAQYGDEAEVADIIKRAQGNGFSGNDMFGILFAAMRNDEQRQSAWYLFQASFDNIVPQLPEIRKAQMPSVTGSFCSGEDAQQASDFFHSKAALIPGYERSLALGVERAQLCGALKAAKADELATALKER